MRATVMAIVGVFIPILTVAAQVGMRKNFEPKSQLLGTNGLNRFIGPEKDDYETSSHFPKRYYVHDDEPIEDKVVILKERLESFIKAIKYFARDASFDFKGFEEMATSLSIQLADVESWVHNLPPRSDIMDMLHYAEEIFHTMISASYTIKYFNIERADHILLRKMTQLNVGLYHLQNSHGMPDVAVSGYANTVRRLIRVANYMSDLFQQFKNVSFGVRDAFQSSLKEARKTLSVLAAHIPQPEISSTP
ncbi:hypothetical protein OY671_000416 [Metschnikowia pulcherrima]|nr:hypothetical protein OY671_000416 [Metschnikowia pulcherrima]